jgi:hypothetical protein
VGQIAFPYALKEFLIGQQSIKDVTKFVGKTLFSMRYFIVIT